MARKKRNLGYWQSGPHAFGTFEEWVEDYDFKLETETGIYRIDAETVRTGFGVIFHERKGGGCGAGYSQISFYPELEQAVKMGLLTPEKHVRTIEVECDCS